MQECRHNLTTQVKCPSCAIETLLVIYKRTGLPRMEPDIWKRIHQKVNEYMLDNLGSNVLCFCTRCTTWKLAANEGQFLSFDYLAQSCFGEDDPNFVISGYDNANAAIYFWNPHVDMRAKVQEFNQKFNKGNKWENSGWFYQFFLYKKQVYQEYGINVEEMNWCDECITKGLEERILFNLSSVY